MKALFKKETVRHHIFIAVVGIIIYANSFGGEFIWDDASLVRDNVHIRSLAGMRAIFRGDIWQDAQERYFFYRPLQMASYALDYAVWGDNPAGYHISGTLAHVLAAMAVYWLISALFGGRRLALWTGLIFLAHPAQTEAVSYISGRADPLAAVFIILSLLFYSRYDRTGGKRFLALAVPLYGLALLSRESALVMPLLLVVYHAVFRRKPRPPGAALILAAAGAYLFLQLYALDLFIPPHLYNASTLPQRMPGVFAAIASYARLLLLPFGLHMEYGNKTFDLSDPAVAAGMGITLLCVLWAFRRREKEGDPGFFGILWLFAALLPQLNIYPLNAYMAEHWLYLPMMGFALIVSHRLDLYYKRRGGLAGKTPFIALLVFYSVLTVIQNTYWLDPVTFYKRTISYAPGSSKLYYNLGNAYYRGNRHMEAISSYKRAADIDPEDKRVYHNLGNAYIYSGKRDEAIEAYKKSIEINPSNIDAYNNLAVIYYDMGRKEEAIELFRKVKEMDPHYPGAGNLDIAIKRASGDESATAAPDEPVEEGAAEAGAARVIAFLHAREGRYDEAAAILEREVSLNPGSARVRSELGVMYAESGRHKEAIEEFTIALEIDPGYAEAHNNMAACYYDMGDYAPAMEHLEKAASLGFPVDERFAGKIRESLTSGGRQER